jgi:hypothetical protein
MGGLFAWAKKSWTKTTMASLRYKIRQNPSLFGKLLKLSLPRVLWRHTLGRDENSGTVTIGKIGQPACDVSSSRYSVRDCTRIGLSLKDELKIQSIPESKDNGNREPIPISRYILSMCHFFTKFLNKTFEMGSKDNDTSSFDMDQQSA